MTDEKYAEIEVMVKNGDVAEAAARLDGILAADPDDDVAQLLHGTCAQLLGNEAEFGRVHAELQKKLDAAEARGERSRRMSLWAKYKGIAACLAVPCTIVATTVMLCGCYGCPQMRDEERPVRDAAPDATRVDGVRQ